jgi:Zn-finger domain-containing protein
MNESLLIGKAEKFLKSIGQEKIEIQSLYKLEIFTKFYLFFQGNLNELQELRDTMEIKGYKAPYRSIIKYGHSSSEMQVEDLHDITRHTQHFRMKAAAKKNILDRIKSSIASHKIVLGHLDEYAIIKCESCSAEYRGNDIKNVLAKKCQCGSIDLKLVPNKQGVYRLEIIRHLPISGDYMVKMSELSPLGRDAFRKIVRMLKQEKRGIVKTLSLVVKIYEDGRWVRKRVNLDAVNQAQYEKEIRKRYGPDARIEFMQFHRKRPSIINDKQVQTALSLGYVKYAEEEAGKIIQPVIEELLINPGKLQIYDKSLMRARNKALEIGEYEDINELQKELLHRELTRKGLMGENGNLDDEIQKDLEIKDAIDKCLLIDLPRTLITWDIIKYYLTTSYDHRNKYSGPFPNLRPSLDSNQTKSFQSFKEQVLKIIKSNLKEDIPNITDVTQLLSGKFDLEKKIKGLHVKTNPSALGAAILNLKGNISLEESAHVFCLKPVDVQSERDKIKTFQKPVTSKAQRFLEIIKE